MSRGRLGHTTTTRTGSTTRSGSGRLVVRLALPAVLVGMAAGLAVRAEDKAAEQDQAAAKLAEQAARQAQQAQQAQIEQHARHIEPQLKPLVQAQLDLARATCGSLPAAVRREVAAAAQAPLRSVATELAARQMGGRPGATTLPTDPVGAIHEALAKALEPHVPAAECAAFRREHAAATARHARAARMQIVAKLDQRLTLSGDQRTAIEADLERHWRPAWMIELADRGTISVGGSQPAADFADQWIAPHLDDRQRADWKAWCKTSGWQTNSVNVMTPALTFTLTPLPPDPWWMP